MTNVVQEIPTTKLPNGAQLPVIGYGLGTAAASGKRSGGFLSSHDKELVATVEKAIGHGYHHLDGAESYGTDPELGMAIKNSKVPREKFFVTAKIWPKSSIDNITGAFEKSLKDLKLDYVDLFLIHEPFWAEGDESKLQSTWKEMEDIHATGKTKAIGVSNYLQPHIEAILKTATIRPAVNQIEFHPYLQRSGLVPWLQSQNIQVCAYAPLTPCTRAKGQSPEFDTLLDGLAKKYYVSPGEILLRWCIDQDVVPITTTSKDIRMSDYLRAITFKLTPKELKEISELGDKQHHRAFWTAKFDGEKDQR